MKILICPISTGIGFEIFESLKYYKNAEIFGASSNTNCSFAKTLLDKIYFVENAIDYKVFSESIINLCIDLEITHVFPAHDDVCYYLSQMQQEMKLPFSVIGQNFNINKVARFKKETYEHLKKYDFIAKVYSKEPIETDFPMFCKPNRGAGSRGARIINNISEYCEFVKNNKKENFVFMELLTGKEYTIDCFSEKGKLKFVGPRERSQTLNGISSSSKVLQDVDKDIFVIANKLNSHFKFNGVWFFQLKYDRQNKLKLLEIAPRIAGTMSTYRANGINFAELAVELSQSNNIEILNNNFEDYKLIRKRSNIVNLDLSPEYIFVDFDDTIYFENKTINYNLIGFLFKQINKKSKIVLITKHDNSLNNLKTKLIKLKIYNIFDKIIHINKTEKKSKYIKQYTNSKNAIFIDDSFSERKDVMSIGIKSFSPESIELFY